MTEAIIQQPEQHHWHISKRVGFVLLALAGFTLYFVFVALMPQSPLRNTITSKTTPTVVPSQDTTAILSFQPQQVSVTQQATATIQKSDITIDTGKNKVTVIDIELGYNPSVFSNVDINPGTFFQNPVILLKNIDTKNGKISYIIGMQLQAQGTQGKGTAATLTYSIQPTNTQTKSSFVFLPNTLVGAQGINQSVLKSTSGFTIYLNK